MIFYLETFVQLCSVLIYGVYTFLSLIFYKIIPRSKKSLDGEVFLITGAGSGIGRQVAIYLAKKHVKTTLVLWDCNEVANEETAETAKFFGAKVFCYKIDIANQTEVVQTLNQVIEDVGNVTILFNNAGVAKDVGILNQSPEEIEQTIRINLLSHFWILQAVLPTMIQNNHGHIVTTCSVAGWVGLRNGGSYTASKFAVRGYLECLQSELRHHPLKPTRVRFLTVYPWFVQTPLIAEMNIKFKYPWLSGFLETRYVAENIVDAICENEEVLFLPRFFELLLRIKSLFPQKFYNYIEDLVVEHIGQSDGKVLFKKPLL